MRGTRSIPKCWKEKNIVNANTQILPNKHGGGIIENGLLKQNRAVYFMELFNEEKKAETCDDTNKVEIQELTSEELKQIIRKSRNLKGQIHEQTLRILREETIPRDWEVGQRVTLYKNGDRYECKNIEE